MLPDPSGFTLQPSPPILRRPFRVTPRGITAHGRFCFDVALASIQFEAPAEHTEQAANDRFESFLDQSTTKAGANLNVAQYKILVTVVRTDSGWLVSDVQTL